MYMCNFEESAQYVVNFNNTEANKTFSTHLFFYIYTATSVSYIANKFRQNTNLRKQGSCCGTHTQLLECTAPNQSHSKYKLK